MAHFQIHQDYSMAPNDGATLQLAGVELDTGDGLVDVTDRVDQGLHFHSEAMKELNLYLSKTFDIPESDIDIEAV